MAQLLVTRLAPIHAQEAARLHIGGQPGTFLTALGDEVLAVVYRALPQSRGGFGFAVVDTALDAKRATAVAPLLGYVSATKGIGALFVEMAAQRLGELLPPLLHRFRQQPTLALRSIQTVLYPLLKYEDSGEGPSAELLSIMVEPQWRAHGVGALLMAAFLQECRNRGLAAVTVTVDSANTGAQRFYVRHGFAAARTITIYGREMIVFKRFLQATT